MRFWIACIVLSLGLAGCAENADTQEAADAPVDDPSKGADPGPAGNGTPDVDPGLAAFNATLVAPANATAGAPFNVTLASDLPADAAANATWMASLANATGAVAEASGTGVPATFDFTVGAGNYTLSTIVMAEGYNNASADVLVVVAAGADEVSLPDPVVWTGTTGATGVLCDTQGDGPETGGDGYHYFTPADFAGWTYRLDTADGLETKWWAGADSSQGGGTSGNVPSGRDNVGVCPDSDVAYVEHNTKDSDYVLTLYPPGHPDG